MRLILALAALLVALPASTVTMDWVDVGDPGNAPDTAANCVNAAPDCGAVADAYRISKYEVTNSQYAEFLNVKAASDPFELYNTSMGDDVISGGIKRSGPSSSYSYAATGGFEDKPVVYVSFWDAVRFANWLHNGQGSGDTETGAYTLASDGIANNTVVRNLGAKVFVPSESEWYKAAYYDPALPGYYEYPAGTDTPTSCTVPGAAPNTANCDSAAGALTDVGSYTGSESPYATLDQGGNAGEWNEEITSGSARGARGGTWFDPASGFAASYPDFWSATYEVSFVGLRVASAVPEPAQLLLVLTGGLALAAVRRKRRA